MGFWTDYCSISLDTALPPGRLLCDVLCVSFLPLFSAIFSSTVSNRWSHFRMSSGHRVQRMINVFKDDQDENEIDNLEQPRQVMMQNRGEYSTLE